MEADAANVVFAGLLPHPPVIVPEVGRGREREAARTVDAAHELARRLVEARPEALVLISPHSPRKRGGFGIWQLDEVEGSLAQFGAPSAEVQLPADPELRRGIADAAASRGLRLSEIAGSPLDHGAVVPLWFLCRAGWDGPTVVLGLNYPGEGGLAELGEAIAEAAGSTGRRVAVVASGDMSHRLRPGAPGGHHPDGQVFDETFVSLVSDGRLREIAALDPTVVDNAGEDVVDSTLVAIAASGFDAGATSLLSYEGPFGVGYAVAVFHQQDGTAAGQVDYSALPAIARRAVEAEVSGLGFSPDREQARGAGAAAVFVTIRDSARKLRGCVGTLQPTRTELVDEVAHYARQAALHDRRFAPVSRAELADLCYEVSVLGEPEPATASELDPSIYGVVVSTADGRRGVMLPGVPGLDTVEAQLSATRRKAGIAPDEAVTLERFRVVKVAEPKTEGEA